MLSVLLDFLETWTGRGATQLAIEQRGFFVHRAWQERVLEFCSVQDKGDIQRYWDEKTREFICSGGKADPDSRKFGGEHRYRSSYLDELAAREEYKSLPIRYPPLLKCIFDYNQRFSDRTFRETEVRTFEALKDPEIHRHAISADGWTGLKRDALPFVTRFAVERGFRPSRNRFRKLRDEIVFEIHVDLGGNQFAGVDNPLRLYIFHRKDQKNGFEVTSLDMIIPGFSRYAYCASPESHVLGMLACVELMEVLMHMFTGALGVQAPGQ